MSEEVENPEVRAHREVVERLWTTPVLQMCDSALPNPADSTVLAAEVRCGKVVTHWLESLPASTRLMALESSGPMLDEARRRVDDEDKKRLFFVEERVNDLSYADDVFDGAICLHGLVTLRQTREGLEELSRVISSGSPIIACIPSHHSFSEFYDLFDEALRACQLEDVLPRIDEMRADLASPSRLYELGEQLGLEEVQLSELDWTLGFEGGREYLYSPVIQETFFPHWIGAVRSAEREEVLDYLTDAIDTYWSDERLETRVRAVLMTARKPQD